MGAPKGNQFWKQRSKHGRDKIFESPQNLLDACYEFFEWCDANPIKEQKIFNNKGEIVKGEVDVMRAYTWEALEVFIGIYSLRDYKTNEKYKDFSQVIAEVERIMYSQKFTGAAGGLLNANIIARDLKLAEKQEVATTATTEFKVGFE